MPAFTSVCPSSIHLFKLFTVTLMLNKMTTVTYHHFIGSRRLFSSHDLHQQMELLHAELQDGIK